MPTIQNKTFHPRYFKVVLCLLGFILFGGCALASCVGIYLFIIKGKMDWLLACSFFVLTFGYIGYVNGYFLFRFTCWVKVDGNDMVIIHPFLFRRIKINRSEIRQYNFSSVEVGRYNIVSHSAIFIILSNNKVIEFTALFQSDYKLLQNYILRSKARQNGRMIMKRGLWRRKVVMY